MRVRSQAEDEQEKECGGRGRKKKKRLLVGCRKHACADECGARAAYDDFLIAEHHDEPIGCSLSRVRQ